MEENLVKILIDGLGEIPKPNLLSFIHCKLGKDFETDYSDENFNAILTSDKGKIFIKFRNTYKEVYFDNGYLKVPFYELLDINYDKDILSKPIVSHLKNIYEKESFRTIIGIDDISVTAFVEFIIDEFRNTIPNLIEMIAILKTLNTENGEIRLELNELANNLGLNNALFNNKELNIKLDGELGKKPILNRMKVLLNSYTGKDYYDVPEYTIITDVNKHRFTIRTSIRNNEALITSWVIANNLNHITLYTCNKMPKEILRELPLLLYKCWYYLIKEAKRYNEKGEK